METYKNKIAILGVGIDNLILSEALGKAERFLNSGKINFIATPNPEIILAAKKDDEFRKILNSADLALADGVGLIFASRFLKTPLKQRISGVDFTLALCGLAEKKEKTVFLLGGGEGVAEKTGQELKKLFPRLKISGTAGGTKADNFPPRNVRADILFAAFGAPKQEKWIFANLTALESSGVKIALGVGGAVDIISGRLPRAPLFLRRIGLEWLWRLILEPRRLKRIFNAVIIFPSAVIKHKFKKEDI